MGARIVRPPRHDVADQLARADPQPLADRRAQRLGRMVQRQGQFSQADHLAP